MSEESLDRSEQSLDQIVYDGIDSSVDSIKEKNNNNSSLSEQEILRLENQAEKLRNTLKKVITQMLMDGQIWESEWRFIFYSIPEDLRKTFNITNVTELQSFIFKREHLSEQDREKMIKALLEGDDRLRDKFYYGKIQSLSQEDAGEIIYRLVQSGEHEIYQPAIPYFIESPLAIDILLELQSHQDISNIFLIYGEYLQLFPQGVEILIQAAEKLTEQEALDAVDKYASKLLPAQKEKIINAARATDKAFLPLIQREYDFALERKDKFYTPERTISAIKKDPALVNFYCIPKKWIVSLSITEEESDIANAQAMVARNLYFQGREVSEKNVRAEVQRIEESREKYRDVPIFSGRNVVFLAHNEIEESDNFGDLNRFGKRASLNRIQRDTPKVIKFLRPGQSLESLKDMKQKALESIKNTNPPFTFIFNGHGGEEAIYLSDGQISEVTTQANQLETQNTIKITVQELFEAYNLRQPKFAEQSNTPGTMDIFINLGCFGSTFIRNFYALCEEGKIQKPIFISQGEYGQLSTSELGSKYGDTFFTHIFNDGWISDGTATIENIIDSDSENDNSNPSMYIPTDGNVTMQISKHNQKQDEEPKAA